MPKIPAGRALDYANKHVVVTGCSSGIGHSTARLLLELGAHVHGFDVRATDLPLQRFTSIDLRSSRSIETAAADVTGRVDALFNCAGVPPGPPPLDIMKVNFLGTRHLTQLLAPAIPAGGAIANVASNGGLGWSGHLADLHALIATDSFATGVRWIETKGELPTHAYAFSKEAIIVWTMTSAIESIKRGVRVNCTNPGAVQTPMLDEIEKITPTAVIDAMAKQIGRRSNADEQAWPLLFLNSDLSSYLNGAVLPVDGGYMAAHMIDRAR